MFDFVHESYRTFRLQRKTSPETTVVNSYPFLFQLHEASRAKSSDVCSLTMTPASGQGLCREKGEVYTVINIQDVRSEMIKYQLLQ